MSLNKAVRDKLLATSAVSSKVGTRVYPKYRAEKSTLPAVVLHKIAERMDQHMSGPTGTQGHRIQADCYGKSKAEAEALSDAVASALIRPESVGGTEFQGGFINLIRDEITDAAEDTVHIEMVDATVWIN